MLCVLHETCYRFIVTHKVTYVSRSSVRIRFWQKGGERRQGSQTPSSLVAAPKDDYTSSTLVAALGAVSFVRTSGEGKRHWPTYKRKDITSPTWEKEARKTINCSFKRKRTNLRGVLSYLHYNLVFSLPVQATQLVGLGIPSGASP